MGISHSEAYAAAGVDIEAGYQGVKMMNRYVQRTYPIQHPLCINAP